MMLAAVAIDPNVGAWQETRLTGSPSGSVSLAVTAMSTGVLAGVAARSGSATGG